MSTHASDVAQSVRETGLIAIIRGKFSQDQVVGIAEVLLAHQIPVMEVTLNTTGALPGACST